ncbi:16940_t:CDS:2, partial [Gigaspora margarita]
EVWNISRSIANSEYLEEYINRSTFHRCISDLGGQDILIQRYPFEKYANVIMLAIAHAILNIPVKEYNKADNDEQLNYIYLSSRGMLNLEQTHDGFYICNFLFTIQVKSSDVTAQQPQTLDEKMLKAEYDKVKKAFDKLKNSYEKEFPIKNCDFYGYTFSNRAKFSAANETIDFNTAKDYELKTVKEGEHKIRSKEKN